MNWPETQIQPGILCTSLRTQKLVGLALIPLAYT